MENNDGNPKDGKILDSIKKELRKLKVVVNRDNLFAVSPRKWRDSQYDNLKNYLKN